MTRTRPIRSLLAAAFFASVLLVCPAAANTPLEAAQEKFEAGRYQEAVQLLQPAVAASPRDAKLNFWLARSYHELRDWDMAIRYGQFATHLDAGNSEYFFWLGEFYGAKADDERSMSYARKTRDAYEKAVELDGNNLRARRAFADYHCQAPWIVGGNKGKAREQIAAITAKDPIAGILAQASCDWRGDEEWDKAAAQYRRLFEGKPKNADAYLEAASFYRKRRDAAGLKAATEAAAAIRPADPRLLFYRGVMHTVARERLEEGERQLLAYLKTPSRSDFPDHALAHEWLGKLYEEMGKCPEAKAQYEKALQLDRKLKDAKDNLKRLKC